MDTPLTGRYVAIRRIGPSLPGCSDNIYVINEIKLYLNKQKNVFEWGSGGSSVFLAKLVNSIISVENNPKWTELVKSTLQEKKLTNASILQREINLEYSLTGLRLSAML